MKKFFLFIIKFVVILAILAVAGYYSFNVLMSAFVREKSEVLVPDLQGKNLVECLDMLSQSKLALMKEGSEFNQDIPAGIVIRQVPPAGMNVKEGKVIKIVISQGGEIVYVPDLKGQTIRAATISLRSLGLVLGELTKKSSAKYEEGIVLSQDPAAGSTIEKDSSVNVLVSNGAPADGTVLMPDWCGKPAEEAKKWAIDENYDVEVISKRTSLANPGEVFKQNPKFDERIKKDTKITFYVADENSSLVLADKIFEYVVPEGNENKRIRLVLNDESGERDIFNGIRGPKTTISVPVKVNGKATVKVFINNISIEERDF
ncbi:MAG: PASTA domain-containing protein [Endomicrobiaceae bacterium]|nr:PASTA domain-containing protein [Endomicrobiaceae bacterium]